MQGMVWEVGLADFLIITLVLGGGAAFLTGRAVARSWQPIWRTLLWMIPLACAARFIHFAFFHGTLLSPQYYLVDLAVLLAASAFGHRLSQARQMAARYPWLIARSGPLSWRLKGGPS
jgi:hypothetical protein